MSSIILTGSTGNLGTYLLAEMAAQPSVKSVDCLNRSLDSPERQAARLHERGLQLAPDAAGKVRSHRCDFDDAGLGLNDAVYHELQHQTTHVLHCAWPVDFNRSFESFLPSIRGVANLVHFAGESPQRPHLLFVSSISAAGNWGALPGARATVPEDEIDDWKAARMGYGQSKLVAERLLADAATSRGLHVSICRVGQVAGPIDHGTKGIWPQQEWLPSLVASSRCLRMLPLTLGPLDGIDWVPVDRLSSIVRELLLSKQDHGAANFHHIVNPQVCAWSTLLPAVTENAVSEKTGQQLQTVSFPEWVSALEESTPGADVSQNPAIKLLDFFTSLREKAVYLPRARAVRFDVKRTSQYSETLAMLGPVQPAWMDLWMQQWAR